jgi:penicillin-binding protein 2
MVAGKTGTAQVIRMGKNRVHNEDMAYLQRDHGWFVGFAPAENPEIAVAVVNEHGGEGASASEPTVMKVIEGYFKLKAEDQAARAPTPPPPPQDAPQVSPPAHPSHPKHPAGLAPKAQLAAEHP